MAISRLHTWSAGEILLASDLNSEFNNIINNGADLVSPFTKAMSMGGFTMFYDASNSIGLTSTTNGLTLTGGALNTPQGVSIASSSTVNLDTATGNYPQITGVVAITAITLSQGRFRFVEFAGALTLTNGASLILPGGANITTAAGDCALFFGEASSVVRCIFYTKAASIAATLAGTEALTNKTYNGNTLTAGTGTLTLGAGKTTTFDHTSTFTTTDAQTYTFPTTSATLARTDAANTFTGHQTIEGVTSTGATGTQKFVFDTAPTISSPTFTGTVTGVITEGTAVATTSGTTASFASLPAGIKKIILMLKGVSTNGTSSYLVQLSQSATFATASYEGAAVASGGSSTAAAGAGFPITVNATAADTYSGMVILTREKASSNTWAYMANILMESGTNTPADFYTCAGYTSLSGTLDGIRLTTVSADTFDAGEINIQYTL